MIKKIDCFSIKKNYDIKNDYSPKKVIQKQV